MGMAADFTSMTGKECNSEGSDEMEEDVSTAKDHPMKKERESTSILPENPDPPSTTKITGISTPSIYHAANGVTIDFHSAEFNQTDDLNDCSGNYRFFEPLDGIVTSDMRHQTERLREESCVDASAYETSVSKKKDKKVKMDESGPPCDLSPLTVISEGRILIVDTDAARAARFGEILSEGQLTCTLVATKKTTGDGSLSWLKRLTLIEVDDVSITGAFGGFSAIVTVKGEQRPLTERFDLVLDLRPTQSFAGMRLPIGYYQPGTNAEEIERVMAELPEMRGRFKKPRFLTFVKSRCFHGRSRTLDCRRCMEVCPFGAIQSEDGKISIDHYVCQGCGGCALVCPTDAIYPVHPPREELLNTLRERLTRHEAGAAFPITLVISDGGTAGTLELLHEGGSVGGSAVDLKVEEIGHIGLEVILTALSHGADKVVVACERENPQHIIDAVAWQAEMARAILKGLDLPEDGCRFVVSAEKRPFEKEASRLKNVDEEIYDVRWCVSKSSASNEKRALILLAVQHLYEMSGGRKPWLPLPAGSPFGAVRVDRDACTLCMACAAACPSGALTAGGDVPRLLFLESRCHQCGLCAEKCPEHAIQLQTRMMCDPEALGAPAVLHEADVFRCIKCNAPFASQAMVGHMTEKLKGHWMYANERQLRRLQMCRVCRTRDALVSEDIRLWNR